MLLSTAISNFYSINKQLKLNFDFSLKNSSKRLRENLIYSYYDEQGRKRGVTNGAFIYGANASGKTNIIKSFDFLHDIICSDEIKTKRTSQRKCLPFKFSDTKDDVSTMSVRNILFLDGDSKVKTKYSVKYNNSTKEIQYEKFEYKNILKSKTENDSVTIFERDSNSLINNIDESPLKEIFRKISQENIKYNSLFFYLLNDINKDFYKEEISDVQYKIIYSFYKEIKGGYHQVDNNPIRLQSLAQFIVNNKEFKDRLLDKLNDFDFAINDIEVIDNDIQDADKDPEMADYLRKIFKFTILTRHNVNGESYRLSINNESNGTNKFLLDFMYLQNSLLLDKLFIEDEFDSKYHIKIQETILNYYKKSSGNNCAQFIIATQNPLLLNPKEWAKEQINFVEKSHDKQESISYMLSDIENVSYNNHNWVNLYLEGRFGAIPEVFS